jgi:hypothetical protein
MTEAINLLFEEHRPKSNCLTQTCLHVDVAACLREGPAVRRDARAPASLL